MLFRSKHYRFSGKELDGESGLSYFGARYFAPWMARWVSCDPIGARGGVNLFAFTLSSPVTLKDKSGFSAENFQQKATNIGAITDTTVPISGEKYTTNQDQFSGEIIVSEGSWLTKFSESIFGTTDVDFAINHFERFSDGEWRPFNELDAGRLEIGDRIRPVLEDRATEKEIGADSSSKGGNPSGSNPELYGASCHANGCDAYLG